PLHLYTFTPLTHVNRTSYSCKYSNSRRNPSVRYKPTNSSNTLINFVVRIRSIRDEDDVLMIKSVNGLMSIIGLQLIEKDLADNEGEYLTKAQAPTCSRLTMIPVNTMSTVGASFPS
ncbi:hypothetical protein ACTXN8_27050, partial [Pseudomonas helleri]|uniref:hypothetical protein n=1 Tax=Pseudomonas helleri TaxID=1608996 RepID=UPI003FD6BA28